MERLALFRLSVLAVLLGVCHSWDQNELDLFDLVEEVGENFYDLLHVDQTASAAEIRRSYRTLSLQHHPDKNNNPLASEKFRKLAAVAEVLKDHELRASYDRILVEGLPDWKQPVYYYRRMRKMGLLELCFLLMLIATVGHYLFGWAAYVEKYLVLQELLDKKEKKEASSRRSRQSGGSQRLEAELQLVTAQASACIPRLKNLLPIVLARKLVSLFQFCWMQYRQWHAEAKDREIGKDPAVESDTRLDPLTGGKRRTGKRTGARCSQRGRPARQTISDEDVSSRMAPVGGERGTEKTDDILLGLVECAVKDEEQKGAIVSCVPVADLQTEVTQNSTMHHSRNTANRGRTQDTNAPPHAVKQTSKLPKLKGPTEHDGMQVQFLQPQSEPTLSLAATAAAPSLNQQLKRDCKPNRSTASHVLHTLSSPSIGEVPTQSEQEQPCDQPTSGLWTQFQQNQLEWALGQYPKYSKDRWDNVAHAVPGKIKVECMDRCKELSEAVKQRRQ